MEQPQANPSVSTRLLSEGVLLGVVSLVAYAATYSYESGYASHFDLPYEVIMVTSDTVLALAVVAALAVVLLVYVGQILWDATEELLKGPVGRSVVRTLVPVPLFLVTLPVVGLSITLERFGYLTGSLVVLFGLVDFGAPLLSQSSTKGYRNKLLAQEAAQAESRKNWPRPLGLRRGPGLIVPATIVGWLLLVANSRGVEAAQTRAEFATVESEGLVLVRVYGDLAVFRGFDPKTHVLDQRILVVGAGAMPAGMTLKKVGPLSPPPGSRK